MFVWKRYDHLLELPSLSAFVVVIVVYFISFISSMTSNHFWLVLQPLLSLTILILGVSIGSECYFVCFFSLIHFSFGIQKHSETIEFADTEKFFLENTHQIDGLWQAVAHIMKIIIFSFKTSRRHHQCVRTHVIRFTMSDVMKTHISLSSCLFSYDECLLWHSLMIISIGALVHGIRLFYS